MRDGEQIALEIGPGRRGESGRARVIRKRYESGRGHDGKGHWKVDDIIDYRRKPGGSSWQVRIRWAGDWPDDWNDVGTLYPLEFRREARAFVALRRAARVGTRAKKRAISRRPAGSKICSRFAAREAKVERRRRYAALRRQVRQAMHVARDSQLEDMIITRRRGWKRRVVVDEE